MFSASVSCGVGTFYSGEREQCLQCPPGSYQDTVGQLSCEPCPSSEGQGVAGAKNVSQCGGSARLNHVASFHANLSEFRFPSDRQVFIIRATALNTANAGLILLLSRMFLLFYMKNILKISTDQQHVHRA